MSWSQVKLKKCPSWRKQAVSVCDLAQQENGIELDWDVQPAWNSPRMSVDEYEDDDDYEDEDDDYDDDDDDEDDDFDEEVDDDDLEDGEWEEVDDDDEDWDDDDEDEDW